MIDIGRKAGRKMVAVISDMSQPLGRAVGNALEVEEAVQVLKGGGPEDLRQLCLELAGEMIWIGGRANSFQEGKNIAQKVLSDGRALEKFRQMVRYQGGDDRIIEEPERLGSSRYSRDVLAERDGFIAEMAAQEIGRASQHLGAGRLRKEDEIDFTAGIRMHVRIGNFVKDGDVLATLYGAEANRLEEAETILKEAVRISSEPVSPPKLIKKTIR